MDVSCFCGRRYQADDDVAWCPDCRQMVELPRVLTRAEQCELDETVERLMALDPGLRWIL